MPDAFFLIAALLSASVGMGWLALAMDVHWKQVCGSRVLSHRRVIVLRTLAVAALLSSLIFCLLADTATMAALVWMMALAIASVFVAYLLSWRPRALAPLVLWVTPG